ncbi:MAG: NAD-dependent epimerase/dehydratase family protein [Verrucomicrobiales bacterium]|nr:NAD-dependent epimerase/dehydratase family protein [Verrucomicrobiales bacterium]
MDSQSKRYIVTGGAGFIGSHLVERLLADGARVVAIDDLSTGSLDNLTAGAANPRLEIRASKVTECQDLKALVEGATAVFHLAAAVGVEMAVNQPRRTIETNLDETEAVLRAAAGARIPVLLTSSSEVYGKSQKDVFDEGDDLLIGPPHLARWSYACSKLMDEFLALSYAREFGLPVVITRLFNTVGPRQSGSYGMVLPRFIAAAREGRPLEVYGDGEQTRCFCLVNDTVEALVRLERSEAARGEVFNIGGSEEVTIRQLAETVIRLLGSSSQLSLIPYADAYAPGFEDMRRRRPAVEKLQGVTGFRPATSLAEIIRRTAGMLPA